MRFGLSFLNILLNLVVYVVLVALTMVDIVVAATIEIVALFSNIRRMSQGVRRGGSSADSATAVIGPDITAVLAGPASHQRHDPVLPPIALRLGIWIIYT